MPQIIMLLNFDLVEARGFCCTPSGEDTKSITVCCFLFCSIQHGKSTVPDVTKDIDNDIIVYDVIFYNFYVCLGYLHNALLK